MARLIVKSEGSEARVLHLNLGVNRFGRSEGNDFQIEHATVSATHCEITLGDGSLKVRDCHSTNGTFVDGRPINESTLNSGQLLRLGDVELLVEATDVTIAIPKFDVPRPAPPVVLSDGGMVCPRHKHARATHQCTHCREILCDECVHRLRRRGGKLLKLCPLCSHNCEVIGGEGKKQKGGFLKFLQRTVRLPFSRNPKEEED
jgi:hypothetical protein